MATLETKYIVSVNDGRNTEFSMEISEFDEITDECSHQDLVKQVRQVWKERAFSNFEQWKIKPLKKFVVSKDVNEEYLEQEYVLEITKKQYRSKRADVCLWIGNQYCAKEKIEWQEDAA